ncbi:MBOAT family O-acyltransferase [Pinibacter sp. MAH-24]|uniref:MBOAT family O-acyltransferase n=1 Tax=Pinibacter soli TaxID=3044211 RepID=A0ABT6R8A3_9BACT|nr:MBOAT family O-acyltransferase [Pinibacter soli]MDI3318789.1 MBOAT family O-acyltransferase [Pinibacter soli]
MVDTSKLLDQFLYDPQNPLLFNNGFFVFFFASFLLLYYCFRENVKARTYVACLFSLYFFYKASGYFVVLVIFSAIFDYVLSNLIYRQRSQSKKKALLILSIVVNVGLLFYFKYTNFFIGVCNDLFKAHFNPLNILLPVGISFYTFENLSYTIDVYKGEFKPIRRFDEYLLFLSFFPKLVMGPIVRAKDFIPQLSKPYYVSTEDFSKGFYLIVVGLFKKLVISDYITLNFVNYIFDDPSRYTGLECLFAMYGYAIVIYCDFSGYSDVAIGMARWLGIRIPSNFNLPYQSKNITEFWRRWHISLSNWLRDYIYIPLGGNRKGKIRAYSNQFATMLIGGFWHGASWNFIIWGALHGGALAFHKQWQQLFPSKKPIGYLQNALWIFITLNWVCFCWIFFKSATIDQSFAFIKQIFTKFDVSVFPVFFSHYKNVLAITLLGVAMHSTPASLIDKLCIRLQTAKLTTYIIIFVLSVFIYMQFKSAEPVMPIYLQF